MKSKLVCFVLNGYRTIFGMAESGSQLLRLSVSLAALEAVGLTTTEKR